MASKLEIKRNPIAVQWDVLIDGERVGYIGQVTGACNRPTGRWSWNVLYKHIGWKTSGTPQKARDALLAMLKKDGKLID